MRVAAVVLVLAALAALAHATAVSPAYTPYYSAEAAPNATTAHGTFPYPYPLYKQCSSRWGSDVMQKETVCAVGCLMSSVSMALSGHDVPVGGAGANPGTLNKWLLANDGYAWEDELRESVVPRVAPMRVWWKGSAVPTSALAYDALVARLEAKSSVTVANVMKGHHFVLVTGYAADGDTVFVNDPGFERASYSYRDDVVGWRLFEMV